MISLNVEKRDERASLVQLRKTGFIPAVFYGKKEKSTPISVNLNDFIKVWRTAGESSVVTLKVKEGDELEALVHDVDLDPVTEVPRHADFYVFEKGQKIKLEIPIEFTGVAPAVKDLGGILIKVRRTLEVEAEPKNLPHEIKVDISPLATFESQILAKDIALPTGVTLAQGFSEGEVIALVSEAKEEVEETVPVDLSAIEVEKKGKKEEEGAADAGAAKPEKAEKADK